VIEKKRSEKERKKRVFTVQNCEQIDDRMKERREAASCDNSVLFAAEIIAGHLIEICLMKVER
jgi:hypothetical protein